MNELIIFTATMSLVFLRGIQQQNVIHGNYISAAITPYFLAVAEVASVLYVVDTGWASIPWVGTGGAIGVTCAMVAHRRYFKTAGNRSGS
jgi:hypothetical protein